jgi:hypothetical protein
VFGGAIIDRRGVFAARDAKRIAENVTGNGCRTRAKRECAENRLQNEEDRCCDRQDKPALP